MANNVSYGGDYSKYQPSLYNNTGSDSFAISQIGGSVNGYIYEQATYSSHAQQAKARGWRFHTYVWMQTGSSQYQTQQMLSYFIPRLQQPKGAIVALDYEAGASGNVEANTDNILAGMQQIKNAGYTPMLYSYKPYIMAHVNVSRVLAEFPNSVWVAGYQRGLSVWPNFGYFPSMNGVAIWQYSDYGSQQDLNVDLTGITWNGYRATNSWSGSDNQWQYLENGQAVKNDWRKVDDRWYHFGQNGYAQTGWQKINNRWYYFNVNHDGSFGAALTGWQKINDRWYYMDPENAWCVTGWNKINGKWYYMDTDNAWCLTGLQTIGGKQYYLDPTNAWMVTGKQTINGAEYTTDDSGALHAVAKPQPTQPTIPDQPTEPAKPTVTLSDADRQAIVDELKSYIDKEIDEKMKNK